MREQLRENEIKKLAEATGASLETIYKLNSMGLINISQALDTLILNDWKSLRKTQYPTKQIVKALSEYYDCSTSKVETIIYKKKKSIFYCKECKTIITKTMYIKNNGLCDCCMNNKIKLLL